MKVIKWIGWFAAAAVVGLTAGCNHPKPPPDLHGEVFPKDGDARDVWNFRSAQASAGAREDATLYDYHFDDDGLNSLGEEKLDLMLAAEKPAEPMVVYLDVPAPQTAQRNRQAVLTYLKDRGLQDSQIAVKDGPNPHHASSAGDASSALHALQAQPQGAAQTGTGSTPAASTSNAQPGYQSH